MYSKREHGKATIGERIVAFFVIGFWGLLFGWTIGGLVHWLLFGHTYFIYWYFAFVFAVIGFLFPKKTERFWSPFWVFVLKYFTP